MEKIYDIAIIGGGPSGMTAGIYAKRAGLDVIIFEKSTPGGAVASTFEVANFPSFLKVSGMELASKIFEQVSNLGIPFEFEEVNKIITDGEIKTVECFKKTFKARAVILALGASVKLLNIENERKFLGRGISYCATCDGNFFKEKTVALVGGGNTALEDVFYLSNIAKKVYLIHRRDELRADKILVSRLEGKENVEFVLNHTVTALSGNEHLEKIEVSSRLSNEKKMLDVDGLFVCIGRGPDTDIVVGDLKRNEAGYIITDENMKTNLDGVFAVGDIRNTQLRQIITACADGAIASTKVFEYLKTKEKSK
ncbi:MAG: thioredoxin-disulfide reductase [Clostridia bacterium]|nr:thioredoxin-disulfide reductase [Clostridia bacterium]